MMLLYPLISLLWLASSVNGISFRSKDIVQKVRDAVRPLTNGQLLASGMHLQPPKLLAKKIVENKKKRGNSVGKLNV